MPIEVGAQSYPLDDLSVVELAVGIPGAYCTKLLRDGGADVVKIETSEGDALRHRACGGIDPEPGADSALFQYLAAGKRSVVADPGPGGEQRVLDLVRGADVIVWSRGSALTQTVTPQRLQAAAPAAVICAITPFGLDGPWADRPSTEATLQAMGGAPLTRGDPARPPVIQGGRLGDYAAGLTAAVGSLIAVRRARASGVGELVDTSAYEAVLMTMSMYPVCYESIAGHPHRLNRQMNLPGIHRSKDGFVGFMVVTGQQWLDFCVMVDEPGWLDDESLLRFDVRGRRRTELVGRINDWTSSRSTADILELASALRVPAAEVGEGATIPKFEQMAARSMYVTNPGGGFLQPRPPYWFHDSSATNRPIDRAPTLGEHTATVAAATTKPPAAEPAGRADPDVLPLAGLRVADFTNNWAGPVIGHVLAMHGADVIHVESAQRPDPIRYNSIKSMSEPDWWEYSPLFHGPNFGKRDLTLDMSVERGRELARALIAESDVVLENFSPRVMEAWGLGWDEIRAINPRAIYVRAPAFGISGPWRDRGGYAQTMEMASGLAWLTGWPDDAPEIPNGPMDPLAGGHATIGLLVALEHRRRTGEGTLVEAPMIGGALNVAAELVIGHSAYGVQIARMGNRSPDAAPQGAYRCLGKALDGQDDRWVFVSIETDEQWQGLRRALGDPEWTKNPAYDSAAGRHLGHDALDRGLADWCAPREGGDIVAQLLAEGVPATVVLHQNEPGASEQEASRGFFERVEHPIIGTTIGYAYPARLTSGPAVRNRSHAPLLGEHNAEILQGLLGLSAEDVAQLEQDHVIGRAPAVAVNAW